MLIIIIRPWEKAKVALTKIWGLLLVQFSMWNAVDCDNLWDVNDGVELAEPGDRIGWVFSDLWPVVLGSYKVVVDPHESEGLNRSTSATPLLFRLQLTLYIIVKCQLSLEQSIIIL